MPNDFYNHGSFPTTGSAATSASMRAELDLIAAGFDRMPDLTGTQDRLIVVNSSGTGLTTTNLLKLTPAGFVGIGTGIYSPVTPLHVNANGGEIIRLSVTADAGTQQEPAIGFASRIDDINPAVKISALEFDVSDRKASLLFYTRGNDSDLAPTERMRITHDGNVNIGTGTPTNLLSVTGNANITGNTTLGDASTDTVTVNGYMGVGGAPSSTLGLYVRNIALTGTTQVGVWSAPVSTNAATSQTNAFVSQPTTSAAAYTVTAVSGFRAENAVLGAGSIITNQHGVYIADQTQATGTGANQGNFGVTSLVSSGANKWNIYASGTADNYFAGNVGIGTTAPLDILDIKNQLLFSGESTAFKTGSECFISRTAATGSGIFAEAGHLLLQPRANAARSIIFATGTPSATERMRIDSSGNVGIGTSSPGSFSGTVKLVVGSAATTTTPGAVTVYSGTAAYGGLYFADGTVGDQLYRGAIEYNHPTDALLMYSAGSERMRLDSSGDVGINTTAPNYASWGTALTVNNATTNAGIEIASGRTTNGTAIGGFDFIATANTTNKEVAQISALIVNGGATPTDYGAALRFYTKPDGASLAERMRIDSEGRMDMRSSLTETGSSTASSISATTLTVGGTLTGTFNVGDRLFGPNVEPNTFITALGSGTGGAGTYTVSNSQTVASGTIRAIGGGVNVFRFTDTDTGVNSNQPMGVIEWFGSDASTPGAGVKAYIAGISESLTPDTSLIFGTSDNVASTQAVERMRISSDGRLQINGTNGLATSLVAISNDFPLNTAATAYQFRANAVLGTLNTGAIGFGSSYTLPATGAFSNSYQFFADSLASAGATLTNNFGFYVASQTVGTNIYGFYSNIAAATDRWNFYAGGTANNYFAGNVGIGTTAPTTRLQIGDSTVDINNVLKFGKTVSASQSTLPYISQVSEQSAGVTNDLMIFAGGSGGGRVIVNSNDFVVKTGGGTTPSGTERMRIDSSGNVGIGTTAPSTNGGALTVQTDSTAYNQLVLMDSVVFNLSPIVQTNYRVKTTSGGAYSNVAFTKIGKENTTDGDAKGYMAFATNNGSTVTERMRVNATGTLVLHATDSNGIQFPATQIANANANTLDDYAEANWTPALSGTGNTFAYAANGQVGSYTKIGRQVTIQFRIQLATTGNTLAANAITITGLPAAITSGNVTNRIFYGTASFSGMTTSLIQMPFAILANATSLTLYKMTAAATSSTTALVGTDLNATAGTVIGGTLTYFV